MKASRRLALFLLIGLFGLISNAPVMACAACFGDTSGSKMGNAAAVGIFAMVVIMFGMLTTIALFGWHLAWRAKNPLPDYEELLRQDGIEPNPGSAS